MTQEEDEITLKELILKIQEYINEVIKNWWIIAIGCIFTTSFFLYKHFTHVPEYNAELNFVVEGQGGKMGGLGGLLGSFGLKKGSKLNPYKILQVSKSSNLFESLAFSNYKSDTTIADKILEEYAMLEKWAEKNDKFLDFKFIGSPNDTRLERRVLKSLRGKVFGGKDTPGLMDISLNEETGIYSISTSTTNESLSLALTNTLFYEIKQFFEDAVFLNQKKSAEILKTKVDSINTLKTKKLYEFNKFQDRNRGLVLKESSTRSTLLRQDIQALNMAYAELIKNYEMTDVNLKDLQPLFIEIDRPFSPISPTKSSLLKNLFLWCFLGGFLGCVLIVGRKIFREIMN